jgi:ABC-type phosphate transport system permease subunit
MICRSSLRSRATSCWRCRTSQREAVLALGATRWEMIRTGVLRNARIGIVGAVILGLGRALGETMAVTMVIGNHPDIDRRACLRRDTRWPA